MIFSSNKIRFMYFALIIFIGSLLYVPSGFAGTSHPNAPGFNLKVLNPSASGYKSFSLSAQKGHVIILNFFATWCHSCRNEIPSIVRFYNSYKAKGVIVVGINVNDSPAGVSTFSRLYDITYPVVYASSSLISDYGDVSEIPQTFFISRSGKIMFQWVGEVPEGVLTGVVNRLLSMR